MGVHAFRHPPMDKEVKNPFTGIKKLFAGSDSTCGIYRKGKRSVMDKNLEIAISLLKEWMYEMSGAGIDPPDNWTTDALRHFANLKSDYDRMYHNTAIFIAEIEGDSDE